MRSSRAPSYVSSRSLGYYARFTACLERMGGFNTAARRQWAGSGERCGDRDRQGGGGVSWALRTTGLRRVRVTGSGGSAAAGVDPCWGCTRQATAALRRRDGAIERIGKLHERRRSRNEGGREGRLNQDAKQRRQVIQRSRQVARTQHHQQAVSTKPGMRAHSWGG